MQSRRAVSNRLGVSPTISLQFLIENEPAYHICWQWQCSASWRRRRWPCIWASTSPFLINIDVRPDSLLDYSDYSLPPTSTTATGEVISLWRINLQLKLAPRRDRVLYLIGRPDGGGEANSKISEKLITKISPSNSHSATRRFSNYLTIFSRVIFSRFLIMFGVCRFNVVLSMFGWFNPNCHQSPDTLEHFSVTLKWNVQ